ncbi:hypothetical protein FRB93_005602 [Tulasnella sp. JGI-2019a]|nr:hypothetical protein FRB93_005602 [Tulasnella sp. JGI-2019a]
MVYLSSLPAGLRASFVTSPPQTSPQWTVITIVCIFVFAILTAVPLFVTKLAANPAFCRSTAWVGIIGWLTGLVTVIVLHVTFANAAAAFNMMAANQKSQLVADIGNGFAILWIAFALIVPSLICTLFSCKMHVEPKSG